MPLVSFVSGKTFAIYGAKRFNSLPHLLHSLHSVANLLLPFHTFPCSDSPKTLLLLRLIYLRVDIPLLISISFIPLPPYHLVATI